MEVTTKMQEFMTAACLEVEVGTTGRKGGDSGHGGRTYLRISNLRSADMRIDARDGDVAVVFGGDAELENLIDGLLFAAEVLRNSVDGGTTASMHAGKTGTRTIA
jgi:hypothetical protein